MSIEMYKLRKAVKINPSGVRRLAKYLRLQIDGMSDRHVAKLIKWRITRGLRG